MINKQNNHVHIKEILDSVPKENFQLVKVFNNRIGVHNYVDGIFSDGVVVVKNNKLAGRLEDIKLLESLEPESRKKFLKEGKILSAMSHKNIPQVYDILEYEDKLLFRYEHIEGYSLKEILDYFKKKKRTFPKYVATSIILKILHALNYTHNDVKYDGQKRSIIHCDIKPSNIILCAKDYVRKSNTHSIDEKFIMLLEQDKVEPFLIDFGIAKFRGKASTDGTINYLSPAQVGKGELDWRTDTYQLLLVYYELLTMNVPYSGLSRAQIFREKLEHDFVLGKKDCINSSMKEFIEKGTRRDTATSFKSEKDCIAYLSKIESIQKKVDIFRKYKKPLIVITVVILCVVLFISAYQIWDYKTQSIDAIVRNIEHNPDPTITELKVAMTQLQTRAFEKKYYEPLLAGEFRDLKTGKPLYPSYLDAKGEWVLVGPETDSAGVFIGLLFNYSDRYPKLLDYAKEYAEPLLKSEFDGTAGKRYMYALIPAYEVTHDERYLQKLINISDTVLYYLSAQEGTTQCDDLYYGTLFLYVYNKTGREIYKDFYTHYIRTFIKNNIDEDGYVYDYASVNATSLYGPVEDEKLSHVVISTKSDPIGNYILLSTTDNYTFKNITSPFSKDFIEVLLQIKGMYIFTGSPIYGQAYDRTKGYYMNKMPYDNEDYLFVSDFNEVSNIPKDTSALIKSVYLFQMENNTIYKNKLRAILSSKFVRTEEANGIYSGGVYIDNINYAHSDEIKKNQTLIETDVLFLKLG